MLKILLKISFILFLSHLNYETQVKARKMWKCLHFHTSVNTLSSHNFSKGLVFSYKSFVSSHNKTSLIAKFLQQLENDAFEYKNTKTRYIAVSHSHN